LLTVLPSVTATGRNGIVRPSISIVAPTCAWPMYSSAMRRIVAAGTSQIAAAHSGEYGRMCSTRRVNAVAPPSVPSPSTSPSAPISTASRACVPSSASTMPALSCGSARALVMSQTSGFRVDRSRRYQPCSPTRYDDAVRRQRNGTSRRSRGTSCSRTCRRANRNAASVFGLIGSHSAEHAPVTERCGSTWIRFMPRTRACAWRQTPTTPPDASTFEPHEIRKSHSGVSGATMNARCQNSPYRCSE
jgi:hypothetical protein